MRLDSQELINFVRSIVFSMGLPKSEYDDAVGDGLLAAVYYGQRFDPDRGTTLPKYLSCCVFNSVRNGVSKRSRWEPTSDELEAMASDDQHATALLGEIISQANGTTKTGIERSTILESLALEAGNMKAAARMAGVSETTVQLYRQSLRQMYQ